MNKHIKQHGVLKTKINFISRVKFLTVNIGDEQGESQGVPLARQKKGAKQPSQNKAINSSPEPYHT